MQITLGGWIRVALRASALAVLVFGCLAILLFVRLIERPLWGMRRPLTPWITRFVCLNALRIIGIAYIQHGRPMSGAGVVVANHASWLDIFTLNAAQSIYFVSKAEVSAWPGIGWLARATGTVFVRRDRREARAQTRLLAERLREGHKLAMFPEGTSTDGLQVLTFKSTLYQAILEQSNNNDIAVQPVSIRYHAPPGHDPRLYGWWGDMEFGPHLLRTLATAPQGNVTIQFNKPLQVSDYKTRKELAKASEIAVRAGFDATSPHMSN